MLISSLSCLQRGGQLTRHHLESGQSLLVALARVCPEAHLCSIANSFAVQILEEQQSDSRPFLDLQLRRVAELASACSVHGVLQALQSHCQGAEMEAEGTSQDQVLL